MTGSTIRQKDLGASTPPIVAAVSLNPPESGMAVMNRMAVATPAGAAMLAVVDISMCRTMSEMRRVSVRKVLRLFAAPFRIIQAGRRTGSRILYFVPSSPSVGGLMKDAWILALCGLWFRQRVYHCHSGGVGVFMQSMAGRVGWVLRQIVGAPLAVIRVSPSAPADHVAFGAAAAYVVPNCVADERELLGIERHLSDGASQHVATSLLFVGLHSESKGLLILLEGLRQALAAGHRCMLRTVGSFNDPQFEKRCLGFVREHGLTAHVSFLGPRFGTGKVQEFTAADALVFPTHFECETFGLVVAESMAAGIPAIASEWSGLRDLIVDGDTGFLTQVRNPESVASAIGRLCADPTGRQRMGQNARQRFLQHYSQASFQRCFGETLEAISRRAIHS